MTLKELKELLQDPRVTKSTLLKEVCERQIRIKQNEELIKELENKGVK